MSATDEWLAWRTARETDLAQEHGWLSLTGFAWLPDRPTSLPGLPGLWWTDASAAHVEATASEGLRVDGEPVAGRATTDVEEAGSRLWVQHGERVVELLRRGGRLEVRTRVPRATTRRDFAGVPTWEHDPDWVRPGRFTAADPPARVEVRTARDDLVQHSTVVGTVDVDIDGVRHRLSAVGAGEGLGLLFHDTTNGSLSAPWRTVTTSSPDPDGNVVVDFNRAVNLPFAFTAYGTCPGPVTGNRIAVPVTAGEKRPA